MEIQTFFLAERIDARPNHCFDVRRAGLSRMECAPWMEFPARFALPALLVLRRESTEGDEPFSLRFDLVDADGRPAGAPRRLLVKGVFPDGYRFFYLPMNLDFEFHGPGSYRLDVTPDEGLAGAPCQYAIDLVPRQQP